MNSLRPILVILTALMAVAVSGCCRRGSGAMAGYGYERTMYVYTDAHPIPGGAWCSLGGRHQHPYSPVPGLYVFGDGSYWYRDPRTAPAVEQPVDNYPPPVHSASPPGYGAPPQVQVVTPPVHVVTPPVRVITPPVHTASPPVQVVTPPVHGATPVQSGPAATTSSHAATPVGSPVTTPARPTSPPPPPSHSASPPGHSGKEKKSDLNEPPARPRK